MIYVFGDCALDTQRVVLRRAGEVRPLRRKVFQVLTYLLAHADRVVSKQELCEHAWPQQCISEAALEGTLKAVRQAIGDNGRDQRLIQTFYGQGYRCIVAVETRLEACPADAIMAMPLDRPVASPQPNTAGEAGASAPAGRTALPYELTTQRATLVSLPPVLDAERRQLTVMFCELIVAPPLASHGEADDLYAVIRTCQETWVGIIQYFGGHIAHYRGEGIVVYFGYPWAHDDDAQRAVRAGLRMVDALRTLYPRLAREYGMRLAVHVGLHTGVVIVGALGGGAPHDVWALGDTPALAAQMLDRAAPDTVVISETTHRLIQGYFTCDPLGVQTCHGVATPLQAYRVVEDSGVHHRLDIAMATDLTPLVGRDHEIGLLVECWGQATEGFGRLALVRGEAGIGKSRLVRVLQERLAAEPHTQIEWRCSPYDHQSALHPVITHLRRLLRVRPEDAPPEIIARLEEVLTRYGFALTEVVPLFASLLSLPLPERYAPLTVTPQRQNRQTLEALVAWLIRETEQHPVLFIIEDLHWIDPSTMEWLTVLLDQVPTLRLLLLVTCRPEFSVPWAQRASCMQITLGRLGRPRVEAMVAGLLRGKRFPTEVLHQVAAHTDGVPLFVEELTKMVLESGLLHEHDGQYALRGPLLPLAIPTTLHDSLMARLDHVAAPAKTIAQWGATIGRTFAYTVLRAVCPWDEPVLLHGLRQLVEAELVYPRGVLPHTTYRFKHALIQETAYQSLLKSTRQQMHRQVAQVLMAQCPAIAETQPELLARHYTEAGLTAQAIPFWQRAGQLAMQRSAHLEAVQHLTTALTLLAALPDTPTRAQQELGLQIILGPALMATKGFAVPEVEQTYARARVLCQQVGATPQLFPTLRGLCRFYQNREALQTAWELAEQLVRFTQREAPPEMRLEAHEACGATLFYLGDYTAARRHLEQGIALIEPRTQQAQTRHGAAPGVRCLALMADTLWCLGYPAQAVRWCQEALALAQDLAHANSLMLAQHWAAGLYARRREASAVQTQAEALLALATAQEVQSWVGYGTFWRGWALAQQGQGAESLAQMYQGLAALLDTGQMVARSLGTVLLAEVMGQVGRIEEGLCLLAQALAAFETSGRGDLLPEVYRLQGAFLLCQVHPDVARAEICFQQALAIAHRQEAKSLELRAAMSLSRLWQQQGKRTAARELLVPIYDWFTEAFDTADLQEAQVLLATLV